MKIRYALMLAGLVAATGWTVRADDTTSRDINWKIRQEATSRSQILQTLHVLTDVYGPRLTGSPNLKAAGEWAVQQMETWGLKNGRLEPWDFGTPGWANERVTAHLISPVKDALVVEVLAWTPSTNGAGGAAACNLITAGAPLAGGARPRSSRPTRPRSRARWCSSARTRSCRSPSIR